VECARGRGGAERRHGRAVHDGEVERAAREALGLGHGVLAAYERHKRNTVAQ
jgi:hypothetical protein